ncbi:MAG: tetratricopeptide repeat protein [Candidatus Kerfeldbacteria bacterium]|nr:tetratricopeptide repeat protein [Candidatus Kerfeldbacteria bacterium]
MLLDLILAATIFLSAVVFFAFVGRKLALLSGVDVKAVPDRKSDVVKEQLIEERFARGTRETFRWIQRWLHPVAAALRTQYQRLVGRLKTLEEQYSLPTDRRRADESGKAKVTQLLGQARGYLEDEQLTEAEQKCIEAISINQYERSAYRLLADIYWERKDYAHAKEVYEFLLKLNTDDSEAHVGLGRIAAGAGEYATAESEFKRSLELSDQASVHLELAEVYARLGDRQRALAATQDALTLDPRNPKTLDYFFALAVECGERALADDAYARLEEVNPENQKLPELSAQLEQMGKTR